MALTTCNACHGQVSSDAKTCPHCGKPLDTIDRIFSAIPSVLTVITLLYFLHLCSASTTPTPPRPPPSREETAACRADIACIGKQKAFAAESACRPALEAYAKYSARWSEDRSTWTYSEWRDDQKTAIVYMGDSLQLQNGFSAWENYIYSCTYDPDQNRVLGVYLAAGRI